MTPQNKPVLLFDLDGTLVNSAPDLALAVNATLRDLHRDEFDQETIHLWVGNGAKTLIERALSGSVIIDDYLDADLAKQALRMFLAHYEQNLCIESCLYQNVESTLHSLKKAGYRLAIITNKPEVFVHPIITVLNIGSLFELILGGDSLTERKPSPLPLLHACAQLGVLPHDCLMIGDSKNDILAAKAANIQSIGLTYGYNYGEDIGVYQPDWRFEHFNDLLSILETTNENNRINIKNIQEYAC